MDQRATRAWAQADEPCDIVMEGGAASGIVYPLAICELARRYRFQRIGGTSAGAVAAAAAAAAEFGRRTAEDTPGKGNSRSFDQLSEIPDWLKEKAGDHTRLRWLFEPEPAMRPAYELFMAWIAESGLLRSIWSVVRAAARHFPVSFLAGAATGLLLAALAVYGALQIGGAVGWLVGAAAGAAGLVAAAVFAVLLALVYLGKDVVQGLPEHEFGVARGYSTDAAGAPSPRLTNWLHGLLQKLAGKPMNEPLTFGDLARCADRVVGNEDGIELRLMTTCLTQGRPYRLPFARDEVFYCRPEELERFFPPDVVTWMRERPNESARPVDGYLALPQATDFPVVVAARMSLAFPLFFSSIPLYAFDRTREPANRNRSEVEGRVYQKPPDRCWFADGGICSNLPVHFFDFALPRWPTFALDLRTFHDDLKTREKGDEREKVWIDADFRDASGKSIVTEWWNRLKHEPRELPKAHEPHNPRKLGESFARTRSFLAAVRDTGLDWNDNAQLRPVGSRDRVAHISLGEEEGSFNLLMDPGQIEKLARRGGYGGEKLRDFFAHAGGWRQHRSARLFSFLAVTDEYLRWVDRACKRTDSASGKRFYVGEVRESDFHPPGSRPLKREELASAEDLLRRALDAAAIAPAPETPGWLGEIEPPPRQRIRFLPEGDPVFVRSPPDGEGPSGRAESQRSW